MAKPLHCITLNVRGMRDKNKRTAVFEWLNHQMCDIAFIQETRFTKEMIQVVENEWDGNMYHSYGTSRCKGVSIFFKFNLCIDVIDVNEYIEGRCLFLNVML